ncbi:helix-turn-helix domain-containing protein [Phycisphaera mikurensis]|uniref:helix-turn-helix domain-containing protein n=1 Tax=Phycisphaera mikurensis TaxID=547188 RepID=UPI00069CE5B2|nr:helix-turn-helix domain-containing protein [Phycisphaera mikurensis]MBB6442076.1 AraC family transcriptional regulator of arabinose operon [Phycisphaera mikurensis]
MRRPETPAPDTRTLVCGHDRRGPAYRSRRSAGTGDHLLIFTAAGAGELRHAAGRTRQTAGEVALYRPGTPQDYRTDPRTGAGPASWELLWAHVRPPASWARLLRWPEEAPGLARLRPEPHTAGAAEASLRAMVAHSRTAHAFRLERAMNALEAALLHLVDALPPGPAHPRVDDRLRAVLDLLHARFAEPWTNEALARQAKLSTSRFAHLFREQLGTTPQRYLEAQRIGRAKELLERSGTTIARVAAEVGFDDPLYFSRRFAKHAGASPRAWQAKPEARPDASPAAPPRGRHAASGGDAAVPPLP